MLLTWLGQSGCMLQSTEGKPNTVLIDPWLSFHTERASPEPSLNVIPKQVDLVLVTHGHADHLDLPGLVALSKICEIGAVVVPTPHANMVVHLLPDVEIIPVQPGNVMPQQQIKVVRAWHGERVDDGYSDGLQSDSGMTPHVGYVIDVDGVCIYHAGDTISTESLTAEVRKMSPALALLPINGRDAAREASGILGNMSADEAVNMAVGIGARFMVPLHFDGARGNTCDPKEAITAAGSQPLEILIPSREIPIKITI